MNIIRTIIAGTVLGLGTGVALAQSQVSPPADQGTVTADAAAGEAEPESTAAEPDAAAASAVVAGSAGAAVAASSENQATEDTALTAEELAREKRAELKAKRKAACEAINVGKPRDC